MIRKIVEINEDKCNGCGQCIPNCHEGALQIIDGKARLISDLFCDGLGNCLGHCPQGAITIIEREAEPYNERKVMEKIVKQGKNTIKAHLEHMKDHGETEILKEAVDFLKEKGIENPLENEIITKKKDLVCGCPGTMVREVNRNTETKETTNTSQLKQWPVQLTLLPPQASFFDNSDLLVSADCVAVANPNFHSQLLKGKSVVIGCPKLDDIDSYVERLTEIIKANNIKSITVAIMEVPCCYGMYAAVEQAVRDSGKEVPIIKKIVSVSGSI